jgi:hypothetical protein
LKSEPGGPFYFVWHAAWCESPRYVVWVDDETAQWCQHLQPLQVSSGEIAKVIHQARRIDIFTERRLVIIDSVEGSEAESLSAAQLESCS